MRMIMLVQFPIEPFNTIARNGSMGNIMRRILESSKPEAAYFSERDGHRGGIFIVNVNEDAEIPARRPGKGHRRTGVAQEAGL